MINSKANLNIKPVTLISKAPTDIDKAHTRTSCIAQNAASIVWEKVQPPTPKIFPKKWAQGEGFDI